MNVKARRSPTLRLAGVEVNKAVTPRSAGQEAGQIIEGNKRYDIVVRMPEQLRGDDDQMKKLPLRVGEHGLLPLGMAVEFQTVKPSSQSCATQASAARR